MCPLGHISNYQMIHANRNIFRVRRQKAELQQELLISWWQPNRYMRRYILRIFHQCHNDNIAGCYRFSTRGFAPQFSSITPLTSTFNSGKKYPRAMLLNLWVLRDIRTCITSIISRQRNCVTISCTISVLRLSGERYVPLPINNDLWMWGYLVSLRCYHKSYTMVTALILA